MFALLNKVTSVTLVYRVVKDVVVPVVARHLAKRRARLNDCKDDLRVLNGHAAILTPLTLYPDVTTVEDRRGLDQVKADSKAKLLRNNHKMFCARWARAAKARFEYARICDDTAVNRAALHRWLLAQWKELKHSGGGCMPLNVMDLYMTDTIDMAFLPTSEVAKSVSKRSERRRARMEFYNERKFVEGWK